MRAPLSSGDLARLESSLQLLLSPLESESGDAWCTSVMQSLRPLLRAEKVAFLLPVNGTASFRSLDYPPEAFRQYTSYYWQQDLGWKRRQERRLDVFTRRMLFEDLGELYGSECYNDWLRPHGIQDSMGMVAEMPEGSAPACLFFHREEFGTDAFGERGLQLLRLLLPAFRAGARMHLRLARRRQGLLQTLDVLSEGLMVCDRAGAEVHRNPALRRMLDAEPERERLLREMHRLAAALASLRRAGKATRTGVAEPAVREVRTERAAYSVRGTYAGGDLLGPDAGILVALERTTPRLPSAESLRARYGLTGREAQVALLLAAGKRNEEIAGALCISPHTARRHTERVMLKLGVKSRAAVGARMVQEA